MDYVTSPASGSRLLLAPFYVLGYSKCVLAQVGHCQSPLPGRPTVHPPCLPIPPRCYPHSIKSPRDNTLHPSLRFLLPHSVSFHPSFHLFICSFSQQTLTVLDCKSTCVLVFRDLMRNETDRTWACTDPHSKGQMGAATYKCPWCFSNTVKVWVV